MTQQLAALCDSWTIHLRAERTAPGTIRQYTLHVKAYAKWCADHDVDPTDYRNGYHLHSADMVDVGNAPSYIRTRQNALRQFTAWMAKEDLLDADPLAGTKLAQGEVPLLEPFTEDEMRRLLATCKGKGFADRRDEALIRFMYETMTRSNEALSMSPDDVNLVEGQAAVRKAKNHKARLVGFGPKTARAIDRYLRVRAGHPRADDRRLWLGANGGDFKYSGMWAMIKRRAAAAGVANSHPHRLRRTGASDYLDAGGQMGSLMTLAGWSDPRSAKPYLEATAQRRALRESRGLDLGGRL